MKKKKYKLLTLLVVFIVTCLIILCCKIVIDLTKNKIINMNNKVIEYLLKVDIAVWFVAITGIIVLTLCRCIKNCKKGYHNLKYCDDKLFSEIDKFIYCYNVSNVYYTNIMRIINSYYKEDGKVAQLVKDKQIEALLLRKDFLCNQVNLYSEVKNLVDSSTISLVMGIIGGSIISGKTFIASIITVIIIITFLLGTLLCIYINRGQNGVCLIQIYEYEISKLDKKIKECEMKLSMSEYDEKYIETYQIALKALVKLKNKDKKAKVSSKDINDLSELDLCIGNKTKVYNKIYHINNKEIYLAYKKETGCAEEKFAKKEFKKLFDILNKYNLINEKSNSLD